MNEEPTVQSAENLDYYAMRKRFRFEPVGSPWFQGEVGEVMMRRMKQYEREIPQEQQVAVSKQLGW